MGGGVLIEDEGGEVRDEGARLTFGPGLQKDVKCLAFVPNNLDSVQPFRAAR